MGVRHSAVAALVVVDSRHAIDLGRSVAAEVIDHREVHVVGRMAVVKSSDLALNSMGFGSTLR